MILCKIAPTNSKESSLGIGNNTPTAEEIDKCWRFVYDIYTKHRDAFESRSSYPPLNSTSTSPVVPTERTATIHTPLMTPRLSSISSTPSSIHEARPSFPSPMASPMIPMHNHLSNSISLGPSTHCQTFEDFMRQYVMYIGHETNVVSRIAVKSHSPLLAVKHPHHSHENQTCAQTFDKTLNDIVDRI